MNNNIKKDIINELNSSLKKNNTKDINKNIKKLYDINAYKEVKKCLEEAIKNGIENTDIFFKLATINAQLENYKKAIKFFKKSIELDNNNINSYINLGICYIHLGDYKASIEEFNRAEKSDKIKKLLSDPKKYICNSNKNQLIPILFYNKAKSLININLLDEAYTSLSKMQSIDTGNFLITLSLSYISILKKEYKNSIDYFNKSMELIDNFLRDYKETYNIKYQYFSEIHNLFLNTIKTKNNELRNYIEHGFYLIFKNYMNKIIQTYKTDTTEIKDNSLFYYTNCKEHTLDTINKEYIYLSNPKYFNDPIDPIIRYIDDKVSKIILGKIGIACLATSPYDILMWSHYANKSSGICIEYDVNNIINNINNIALVKVKYIDYLKYNRDNMFFEYKLSNNSIKNNLQLIDAFSMKHEKWSYENEYRIIKYSENGFSNEEDRKLYKMKIKRVYFGEKISRQKRRKLINILKEKNIQYYDIGHCDNNAFELYKNNL